MQIRDIFLLGLKERLVGKGFAPLSIYLFVRKITLSHEGNDLGTLGVIYFTGLL